MGDDFNTPAESGAGLKSSSGCGNRVDGFAAFPKGSLAEYWFWSLLIGISEKGGFSGQMYLGVVQWNKIEEASLIWDLLK